MLRFRLATSRVRSRIEKMLCCVHRPRRTHLDASELDSLVFLAAAELVLRQREVLPLVAERLGEDPYEYWMLRRFDRPADGTRTGDFPQGGVTADGQWNWFFHGFECDIKNTQDGRFVRVDFGPARNRLTFTGWGIMQFVMTSKPPWREFAVLRSCLARKAPPYDEYSGSEIKVEASLEQLEEAGLIGPADPDLLGHVLAHTEATPNGSMISLPEELRPECPCDVFTCSRLVVTEKGKAVLAGNTPGICPECGESR